jgi:cytochrome c1
VNVRRITVAAAIALVLAACEDPPSAEAPAIVDGDSARGRELARAYGCTACHQMPNIRARTGNLGPPLTGLASRAYLAGRLPNRPGNLVRWIMDAPSFDPATAMPNLRVTHSDAHDIAAYLYDRS